MLRRLTFAPSLVARGALWLPTCAGRHSSSLASPTLFPPSTAAAAAAAATVGRPRSASPGRAPPSLSRVRPGPAAARMASTGNGMDTAAAARGDAAMAAKPLTIATHDGTFRTLAGGAGPWRGRALGSGGGERWGVAPGSAGRGQRVFSWTEPSALVSVASASAAHVADSNFARMRSFRLAPAPPRLPGSPPSLPAWLPQLCSFLCDRL